MQDRKCHGVSAANREFARYDHVRKEQVHRLAEQEAGEDFDTVYRIRTWDIGGYLHGDDADKRAFARETRHGTRTLLGLRRVLPAASRQG